MADGGSKGLQNSGGDDELDELLDSALDDFDKIAPSTTKQTSGSGCQNEDEPSSPTDGQNSNDTKLKSANSSDTSTSTQDDTNAQMEAQFAKAAEDLENAMKTMLGNEPELLAQLDQFTQAAAKAQHDSPSSLADLETNLARTMNHLAQNAKDLENCPTGPLNEDFFKAMTDMNLEGGGEGELDFLPLMQGMMQNLLSKDVLYPALKDLQQKYPAWLEEKKSSLPAEELDRYNRQFSLVSKVCSEYEAESSNDSDDIKKKRFEKLLGLMQQMQECGQPPPELVGEMPPGFAGPIPEMPDPPEIPDELKDECKVT